MLKQEVGRSSGRTAEVEGGGTGIRPIGSGEGGFFGIVCTIADPIGRAVAWMLVAWADDNHGSGLGEGAGWFWRG